MPYLDLDPNADCLIPQIQEIEARTKALTAGLTDTAMAWRPPGGGWSIAQVFEHLVVSARMYFPVMRSLLQEAGIGEQISVRAWKPSLFGRLLIKSLVPSNNRKLPTVAKLKPGPEPRPSVVSEFLATMRETADLVWLAQGHNLRRLRMTSPVSSLVRRLNMGDALIILIIHAQRHLNQIERVKTSPGFPGRVITDPPDHDAAANGS